MRHELTAKIRSNHIHLKLRKMEIIAHPCKEMLNPMVQTKVAFTWRKEQVKSGVLEAEDGTSKNGCYNQHPKQHPAEHLKGSAKCQHLVFITHPSALAGFPQIGLFAEDLPELLTLVRLWLSPL